MSKKVNPNAAFSQRLSPEQKAHYEHVVVEASDGRFLLFPDSASTVAIISPRETWNTFKDFSARVTDAELHRLYVMCYDKEPTKDLLADRVELMVIVWIRLCETSLNRLDAGQKTKTPGQRKLEDRSYELIKTDIPADLKMPPQAKTCLTFFAEMAKAADHSDEKGIFSISEKSFNAYVIANAERLKTKQDPWRIFQYYRPNLIRDGFIRMV